MLTDQYNDETLTAYLDGELDAQEAAQIEAALKIDEALAARLASLEIPLMSLQRGFDGLMGTAPEMPSMPAPRTPRRGLSGAGMAAALLMGISLGAGIGAWRGSEVAPGWKMAIANYQVLYVPRTLDAPAPAPEQASARLAEMSRVLGYDLSAAATAKGLDFHRAQVLGLGGRPLIQMAYMSQSDVPFAICVVQVTEADRGTRSEVLTGLASAHWVEDGFGFLVIGGDDLSFVEAVAEDLRTRL